MKDLAVILRTLQLFTHNAHNLVSGPTFFSDHACLGAFYEEHIKDYDSIIERMIGLGESVDLVKITVDATIRIKKLPKTCKSNKEWFKKIYELECELCDIVNKYDMSKYSEGTVQAIGDVANRSEIRKYKIGQRIK